MTPKEQLELYKAAYKEAQENAAQAPLEPMKNAFGAVMKAPIVGPIMGHAVNQVKTVGNMLKPAVQSAVDYVGKNKNQLAAEAAVRQFSYRSKQDHRKAVGMLNALSSGLSGVGSRKAKRPSSEELAAEMTHSRAMAEAYNNNKNVVSK